MYLSFFLYLSEFVRNNHRWEMPPNKISFSHSSSLIGRYVAGRLDGDWSLKSKFWVNVYKRVYKKKKTTLLNSLSILFDVINYNSLRERLMDFYMEGGTIQNLTAAEQALVISDLFNYLIKL